MLEEIATSWPLNLSTDDAKSISSLSIFSSLRDLAIASRACVDPLKLQSVLQAKLALGQDNKEDCEILYTWISLNLLDYRSFDSLLNQLREKNPSRLEVRALTLLGWLWRDDIHSVATSPSEIWAGVNHSLLLQMCKVEFSLKTGDLIEAEKILSGLPNCLSPEMLMLQASLSVLQGNVYEAIECLLAHLHRCSQHVRYYRQLLNHMIDGKDAINTLPCAKEALAKFGEHPEILYHFTALNLLQKQPGLARRSALLQQISASIRPTSMNLGNQLAAYEANGQAEWLRFLNQKVIENICESEPLMQANLVMQLASIQSDKYQFYLQELLNSVKNEPGYLKVRKSQRDFVGARPKRSSKLSIAWMTGDSAYHPVARFLYGWFASRSQDFQHKHTLISLQDHKRESFCDLFRSIRGIDVHDVSGLKLLDRLNEIRSRSYDIIVDLSGWTGGNFNAGLNARLAPVQVNYLGYFASSGLSSMDYWLGDSNLFPPEHSEWATESFYKLPRPFLAWSPRDPLPEAHASVSTAPSGPIRFGSFNHTRKLSDQTLRLWAEILDSVSGSRLVLKASAQNDSDTQRLLRRRMSRNGLSPDRVDWLSFTEGPMEHLQKYGHFDIALDPIPNGGCTTTCEALWMGVPTITLAGSHYVSRMSTAVLTGANMPEWIASDQLGYIKLACEHAANLSHLRANRDHWRYQLQASPLGDAEDLMHHLEAAFSQMHSEVLRKV